MKASLLIIGVLCILFLYTVPVPIYPQPHTVMGSNTYTDFSTGQTLPCPQYSSLTISQLSGSVSDPVIMGGLSACSIIIGGPAYELYTGIFYVGWIIGALCVLSGFSK